MNFKNKTVEEKAKLYKIAIILVLLLGVAVKCIKMGCGYDAYGLLHYGTDRYGYSWPVYFIN